MANGEMIKRIDGALAGAMRRVEIIKRADGLFHFLERGWEAPDYHAPSSASWGNLHRSGVYESLDEAEREARLFLTMPRPNVLRD